MSILMRSASRALYAKEKLSCNIVESPEGLRGRLKCVFSAHVIEHLADPNLVWNVGTTTLEDGGLIVCFCPNWRAPLGADLRSPTLSPALGQGPSTACNFEFLAKEF